MTDQVKRPSERPSGNYVWVVEEKGDDGKWVPAKANNWCGEMVPEAYTTRSEARAGIKLCPEGWSPLRIRRYVSDGVKQ